MLIAGMQQLITICTGNYIDSPELIISVTPESVTQCVNACGVCVTSEFGCMSFVYVCVIRRVYLCMRHARMCVCVCVKGECGLDVY